MNHTGSQGSMFTTWREKRQEYGADRRNELQEARHGDPKSTKGGNSRAKGHRTQPSSENPQRFSMWERRKLTCITEKKKKKKYQQEELGEKPSSFLFNHKICYNFNCFFKIKDLPGYNI